MQTKTRDIFTTIRTEGAILPTDILQRIAEGDGNIDGLKPSDYHLPEGGKLREAISHSWNSLLGRWNSYITAVNKLSEGDPGTTITREKWLLPLMQELGYGRLPTSKAIEMDGKNYPISHFWQNTPIHLIGCWVDIDKRTKGVAGAAQINPHGMIQEFLNRSDDHLWAFLSNGQTLRILRDNASLTRQAYVEFDLAGMMEGEVYSDFVLLWLLCHQSRVEADIPEKCWLEKWSQTAQTEGTRALEALRNGVEQAIQSLGSGFLSHRANTNLREKLKSGELDKQEYYRQLLRIVYRLIFLFVAEDRGLLLQPDAQSESKDLYVQYYSAGRLRRIAEKKRGTHHHDLWQGLLLVFRKLESAQGCADLGLPALGSYLWSQEAITDLDDCHISNGDFLEAIRSLAYTEVKKVRRMVDYRNLGSEELGSIYESLLELHPDVHTEVGAFKLKTAGGHERKTTGSYYTPVSLVNCLLDSALDPILAEVAKKKDTEQAILNLKVCDPACGSGHFLVAAAHRIAKRLAAVRTGDDEPSPEAHRTALRDVIGRCIYGVDLNPMAIELCKVSLWMEALEPGKPLSFLDHHIRVGNSLFGTTPVLIAAGLPDDTFKFIEGDDKKACALLKKRNKAEKKGLGPLFAKQDAETQDRLHQIAAELEALPDNCPEDILTKEITFHHHEQTEEYSRKKHLADTWCAAFVVTKYFHEPSRVSTAVGITQGHLNDLAVGRFLPTDLVAEVKRLSSHYQFFHWHLAFPEVFANGGFDCVLGNPPWEHTELKEKEWFSDRNPEIANARTGAVRKRMINALKDKDLPLYEAFTEALREHKGVSHFLGNSGRFPFCGRGRINFYAVFAECMRNLLNERGRAGCVLPTGIATDDTTKYFFQDVIETKSLVSLLSFENEEFIFPEVHHATRFCLFTIGNGAKPLTEVAEFVFFARQVDQLRDPERLFTLSAEEIALLNPNTRTCPIFRSRDDAELTKAIYRRIPVMIREAHSGVLEENSWDIRFKQGLFNMTSDSGLFRTREQLEADNWHLDGNIFRKNGNKYLPLYEGKMIHHFDNRWGTYEGQTVAQANQGKLPELDQKMHDDPMFFILPRYWVPLHEATSRLGDTWNHQWLLGWRDITGSTVFRTMISTIFAPHCCEGGLLLLFPQRHVEKAGLLSAVLNSFVFDYCARQKVAGTHLKFFTIRQLPVPHPAGFIVPNLLFDTTLKVEDWLHDHVWELIFTSWDLEHFARDCGWIGPPFHWDEARRFLLRCELDAIFFHIYLPAEKNGHWHPVEGETEEDLTRLENSFPTPRDAVAHIMDTFPIVRDRDEKRFGDYRTKQVILEIYDELTLAIKTNKPYNTRLDPPPADSRITHISTRNPQHEVQTNDANTLQNVEQ